MSSKQQLVNAVEMSLMDSIELLELAEKLNTNGEYQWHVHAKRKDVKEMYELLERTQLWNN